MTPEEADPPYESILLKDLCWPSYAGGAPVKDSPCDKVSNNLRLYHIPFTDSRGFQFCAVDFDSAGASCDDVWEDPDVAVEVLMHGVAYFDGIRHLHMPYWHYPGLDEGVRLFEALRELVVKYCDPEEI